MCLFIRSMTQTLPSLETGLLNFFLQQRPFPLSNFLPLFATLTFSPKQDHTWYHSAKGGFIETNHRGTLHFLSSQQSGSSLLPTEDKEHFADRPEHGPTYPQLASLGKMDRYKWIFVLGNSLYLIVTRSEPNENPKLGGKSLPLLQEKSVQ